MFYLLNDMRPDQPTRKCWECGDTDTPRGADTCVACSSPLADRRFLMSSRWDTELFDAYEDFYATKLKHPGLATPTDVFRHEEQLLSVIPYSGEGLMVDEASPLPNKRIMDLAQRIAGTLAFLHINGVRLASLNRANLLVSPDNTVRLFDLEVLEVTADPQPPGNRGVELQSVAGILRRYCDVRADDIATFFNSTEVGDYDSPASFGREIEKTYDLVANTHYPPLLGGMSDVGLTRQLNEDNWGWEKLSDRALLYVVADGMGGHDGGEVASDVAVRTICAVAAQSEANDAPQEIDALEKMLDHAFQSANNTVKDNAEARGTDMGTTLVCFLQVDGRTGFMANVGDSRGYLLRAQSLHQVTRDHSLVQKMVERGRITAEEARTHPHSNILLRTVGTEKDIDIDIFRVELEAGDRIMMCSDGLWGEVEDRDIETILNTYTDPRIASRELIRAAHHGGGKDNITLVIVTIS
jgi:PPM family protein phosphatase